MWNVATGKQVTSGVLDGKRADKISWTGDGKAVAIMDYSSQTITIAKTPSFELLSTLSISTQGDLVVERPK